MPERARVVHRLGSNVLGTGIWWSNTWVKPDGAQEALDEAERRYVEAVEEVNWSRIAIEAFTRCALSDHPSNEELYPSPCGDCIKAELLVEHSWERGRP